MRSVRRVQIAWIISVSSTSVAPARSGPRRSAPWAANRQVNNEPSEESRAREQSPQNGWLTEETKPTSPWPSSNAQRSATSPR